MEKQWQYVFVADEWHAIINDYYSFVTICGYSTIPTTPDKKVDVNKLSVVPKHPFCAKCMARKMDARV